MIVGLSLFCLVGICAMGSDSLAPQRDRNPAGNPRPPLLNGIHYRTPSGGTGTTDAI